MASPGEGTAMIWLGTIAVATCFFVKAQHPTVGLPPVDPHDFLNRTENCVCCHDTREKQIEPHRFTIDINESCERCHPAGALGHSHPMGEEAALPERDGDTPRNLPLDERDLITCGTCHNPHLPGYTPERFARPQVPAGSRTSNGLEVAYYKSYRLRLHAPDAGNDPTCAGCHEEYF